MNHSNETPDERAQRVQWLQMGIANGLYHPTGDEIVLNLNPAQVLYLSEFRETAFVPEPETPQTEPQPQGLAAERLLNALCDRIDRLFTRLVWYGVAFAVIYFGAQVLRSCGWWKGWQ